MKELGAGPKDGQNAWKRLRMLKNSVLFRDFGY
jgi:hypothetical protein